MEFRQATQEDMDFVRQNPFEGAESVGSSNQSFIDFRAADGEGILEDEDEDAPDIGEVDGFDE